MITISFKRFGDDVWYMLVQYPSSTKPEHVDKIVIALAGRVDVQTVSVEQSK